MRPDIIVNLTTAHDLVHRELLQVCFYHKLMKADLRFSSKKYPPTFFHQFERALITVCNGGPPQWWPSARSSRLRLDGSPRYFFIGDFASPNPGAKAQALWTHHQCGFCGFQYSGRSNQQTFLDQQVREEYRRFHRKNSTAPCGRITMLGSSRYDYIVGDFSTLCD